MLFQASLLLSAATATSSQSRHSEAQRLYARTTKSRILPQGPYQESFFLTADGARQREMKRQARNKNIEAVPSKQLEQKHVQDPEQAASGILMTYMDKEHEQLSADIAVALTQEANVVMAYKEDIAPESALLGHPPGPCVWLVQIAHAQKGGVPQIWKTVMVNGTNDDNFYFKGCTSEGEEGGYCKSNKGQVAGARTLRNRNAQVVEFGSCCDPNVLDTIVNTRMQHCELPLVPVKEADSTDNLINDSSWMRLTHGAPWLQESTNLIRLWLLSACLFIVLLIFFMYGRYKK